MRIVRTLIAFLLSQIGIAGGAIKVRFCGGADLIRRVPGPIQAVFARWRWAGACGGARLELVLAGAAAQYVIAPEGHIAAADPFAAAWHICSIGRVDHVSR